MLPYSGIEKRRTKADLHARGRPLLPARVSPLQALGVAYTLIRTHAQVRAFFGFVFFSIVGIFLQDAILEVGAEVFGMTIKQTSMFSSTWGGGVLVQCLDGNFEQCDQHSQKTDWSNWRVRYRLWAWTADGRPALMDELTPTCIVIITGVFMASTT
jgi:hypothetical protein